MEVYLMSKPIFKINEILENWAKLTPPLIDFTVENVLAAINYEATYDYVLRSLMSKRGFELEVSRIYLCPNNHKAHHSKLEEELDEDDLPECHACGQEIIPDLDHCFLVFNFTDDYLQDAKKKMNQQLIAVNFL